MKVTFATGHFGRRGELTGATRYNDRVEPVLASPLMIMTVAYLCVGLFTTTLAWVHNGDDIEMNILLEDEVDRPAVRSVLAFVFVIAWPILLAELLKKR